MSKFCAHVGRCQKEKKGAILIPQLQIPIIVIPFSPFCSSHAIVIPYLFWRNTGYDYHYIKEYSSLDTRRHVKSKEKKRKTALFSSWTSGNAKRHISKINFCRTSFMMAFNGNCVLNLLYDWLFRIWNDKIILFILKNHKKVKLRSLNEGYSLIKDKMSLSTQDWKNVDLELLRMHA